MEIYQDFKEWLELLNENNVEYVIVGAHALAFYGAPRFTGDLDILVKPDPGNAHKVVQALRKFGFGSLDISEQDLIEPNCVIQLGYLPVRIDLLTTLTGVTWEKIESGKTVGKMGSIDVYYLGRNELIENKKALGRNKDLADIESIENEEIE